MKRITTILLLLLAVAISACGSERGLDKWAWSTETLLTASNDLLSGHAIYIDDAGRPCVFIGRYELLGAESSLEHGVYQSGNWNWETVCEKSDSMGWNPEVAVSETGLVGVLHSGDNGSSIPLYYTWNDGVWHDEVVAEDIWAFSLPDGQGFYGLGFVGETPVAAYTINDEIQGLGWVWFAERNGTDDWSCEEIFSAGDEINAVSLTVDHVTATVHVFLSVYDEQQIRHGSKQAGGDWQWEELPTSFGPHEIRAVEAQDGSPMVLYARSLPQMTLDGRSLSGIGDELRCATRSGAGWKHQVVSDNGRRAWPAINPRTGRLSASFVRYDGDKQQVFTQQGSSGNWETVTIDFQTVASVPRDSSSLVFSPNGEAWLAYTVYRHVDGEVDFKVAHLAVD